VHAKQLHHGTAVQLLDLLLMQLTHWRWAWIPTVITGTIAPVTLLVGLGRLAQGGGPESLRYLFAGAVVLGLVFENQNKVAAQFAVQRETGALPYFLSLPIRPALHTLSVILSFFLLSLPALAVLLLVGPAVLHIELDISPLFIVALPVAVLSMSAVGALIGVSARSVAQADALSLALTMTLIGLGGVLVQPALLPLPFQLLSTVNPVVYAASALRQTMLGPVGPRLVADLAVLLGVAVMAFTAATYVIRRSA
jgi:ABC-2 type transport system permease protein